MAVSCLVFVVILVAVFYFRFAIFATILWYYHYACPRRFLFVLGEGGLSVVQERILAGQNGLLGN